MDELDFTLELLKEKAQLVRSLRKLGHAQAEVGVKAVRSLCAGDGCGADDAHG